MEYIQDIVNNRISTRITKLKRIERNLILFRIFIFFSLLCCFYIFWGSYLLWIFFALFCAFFIISSLLLNKFDKRLASYNRYFQLTEEDKLYFHNTPINHHSMFLMGIHLLMIWIFWAMTHYYLI